MACYLLKKDSTYITIPKIEEINEITYYVIQVTVGSEFWEVKHRYSDFVGLHERLVLDHCVNKDLLPPKKLVGKRDPPFVEKRRIGLENYLGSVISFLKEAMPRALAVFLDFHKYEIFFIIQEMAFSLCNGGNAILKTNKYKFNTLQLHAISKRLKQPCPEEEAFDLCYDFSHVVDLCFQLTAAEVEGSWQVFGNGNIVPNLYRFELSALKTLENLKLDKVELRKIYHMGSLRQTLRSVVVTECNLRSTVDFLMCDDVHKLCDRDNIPPDKIWERLKDADFSNNLLQQFDNGLLLMPNLEKLSANDNQLTNVGDLSVLPLLTDLYLSANRLRDVNGFHLNLGTHISYLDLSQNQISSLKWFSPLISLYGLNLGTNIVTDVFEIQHIKSLPSFYYLVLTGNPVATVVDYRIKVSEPNNWPHSLNLGTNIAADIYEVQHIESLAKFHYLALTGNPVATVVQVDDRIKVFQQFESRAASICLDNEKPSQKELDKLAVVKALKIVKEGKHPIFSKTIEPTFSNSPQ